MALSITKWVRPSTDENATITYQNGSGSSIAANQAIYHTQSATLGFVGVAEESIAAAAGSTGTAYKKGRVKLPAAAVAFTHGACVQWDGSATSVTTGGTASGLICVGVCVESAGTGAGYVTCDLNEGPNAFKVW